jgi:predicted  nucleic acid-binding Zn-ribbon protein
MEMNKTILDLKREVDTIKKTQSEATLEIETLGKRSGTIDASISNRIQEMEERISGAEDSIENIGTTIKEDTKCKRILTQNIQSIWSSVGFLYVHGHLFMFGKLSSIILLKIFAGPLS